MADKIIIRKMVSGKLESNTEKIFDNFLTQINAILNQLQERIAALEKQIKDLQQ